MIDVAKMACQPTSVVYLLILLTSVIAHLCWCVRHVNYNEYALENEKICHFLHKKYTHEVRNATAVIVRSYHMFDRWIVNNDRHCKFVFKTRSGEGLFAVIHRMSFRFNGSRCLDYVRFKRSDGYSTEFCGRVDRSDSAYNSTYFPISKTKDISHNMGISLRPYNYDMFAEFDPGKPMSEMEFETEIFISKERIPDGQSLSLSIIYTPFRNCDKVDLEQYKPVGYNNCIRKEYVCDRIYNCPLRVCSDEANCSNTFSDLSLREDTATEVTVGAVTTVILCLIIFVMCLWICKRSRKLCWSSDCAGPNVCSRPGSLSRDVDLTTSRAVPTAPMLEVAVSSPVADKDLPPSYDSLFPEQSNPARL